MRIVFNSTAIPDAEPGFVRAVIYKDTGPVLADDGRLIGRRMTIEIEDREVAPGPVEHDG